MDPKVFEDDVEESADPEGEIDFLVRRRRPLPAIPLLLSPPTASLLVVPPVPLLALFSLSSLLPSPPPPPPLPLLESASLIPTRVLVEAHVGSAEEDREPMSEEVPDSFEFETSSVELGDSVLEELSFETPGVDPSDRDVPERPLLSHCAEVLLLVDSIPVLVDSPPVLVSRPELPPRALSCWLLFSEELVVLTSVELEDAGENDLSSR